MQKIVISSKTLTTCFTVSNLPTQNIDHALIIAQNFQYNNSFRKFFLACEKKLQKHLQNCCVSFIMVVWIVAQCLLRKGATHRMSQNQSNASTNQPIRKTTTSKKRRRRRPAVVFRASMLVFIWLICFLSCFAAYMIGKNMFDGKAKENTADTIPASIVCTL